MKTGFPLMKTGLLVMKTGFPCDKVKTGKSCFHYMEWFCRAVIKSKLKVKWSTTLFQKKEKLCHCQLHQHRVLQCSQPFAILAAYFWYFLYCTLSLNPDEGTALMTKKKLKKVSESAHSAKKIGYPNPWSMSLLITTMNKMKTNTTMNSE